MDDIIHTLRSNPTGVTPLIKALKTAKSKAPLDGLCLKKLRAKKATAKSAAKAAAAKAAAAKAAATDKYNKAVEKLKSLNKQIAAQGGSTVAIPTTPPPGTAGAAGTFIF